MLKKIVSGGQTGVDRGALDAALARGFPCGGYCPAGRRAEDGRIPARYPLEELSSPHYQVRTRRNVEESDGTLIISPEPLGGGTLLTAGHATKTGQPCIVIPPEYPLVRPESERLAGWTQDHGIAVLNVAGPRASATPDIHAIAEAIVGWLIENTTAASRS
jgi:hypothetical protein